MSLYKFIKSEQDYANVSLLYYKNFENYDAYVCGSGPSLINNRVFNKAPKTNIIGVPKSFPTSELDFIVGCKTFKFKTINF